MRACEELLNLAGNSRPAFVKGAVFFEKGGMEVKDFFIHDCLSSVF